MSLGTGTSLLERLMLHNPLYKKSSGGYDPQFITKLLWNYRWEQGWCSKGLSQAGIGERGTPGSLGPLEPRSASAGAGDGCAPAVLGAGCLRGFWTHMAPTLGTVLPLPGPTRPYSGSPMSSSMTMS